MDFLNKLTTSTQAAETVFQQHPLGTWKGEIKGIFKKTVFDKPVWELTILTAAGNGQHSIWGFAPQDIARAQQDSHERELMVKSIARIKRLFNELQVAPREQVDAMTWSEGDNSILHVLDKGLLVGRKCSLVVKVDEKRPDRATTYVNEFRDVEDQPDTINKLAPSQNAPRQNHQFPPSQNQPPVYNGSYQQTQPPAQHQTPPAAQQNYDFKPPDIPF